ncbi:uncharacterized protein C8Q71DRAFT_107575 [Rhodofomes roseus]|uniref:Uncharacterized protein n=1 Tax=Rhodofomes roseus TaxID=34475 RepID=A0ABQ8KC50_9APHY|nr:uncharacterized protein C8Q71DRAFT_107575 [Rhodofomes roseus]KAH9835185.1 hypothetical protein C8Q71DRAFT_107575 [Rhodofomes roseus]
MRPFGHIFACEHVWLQFPGTHQPPALSPLAVTFLQVSLALDPGLDDAPVDDVRDRLPRGPRVDRRAHSAGAPSPPPLHLNLASEEGRGGSRRKIVWAREPPPREPLLRHSARRGAARVQVRRGSAHVWFWSRRTRGSALVLRSDVTETVITHSRSRIRSSSGINSGLAAFDLAIFVAFSWSLSSVSWVSSTRLWRVLVLPSLGLAAAWLAGLPPSTLAPVCYLFSGERQLKLPCRNSGDAHSGLSSSRRLSDKWTPALTAHWIRGRLVDSSGCCFSFRIGGLRLGRASGCGGYLLQSVCCRAFAGMK